jgi:hypothetical protein
LQAGAKLHALFEKVALDLGYRSTSASTFAFS